MLVAAAARGAAQGAAEAGASRQFVASAVAAAVRAVMGSTSEGSTPHEEEVSARERLARPTLKKLVAGDRPTGEQRAFRNAAWHVNLGEGAEALPRSGVEAKRMQRGGRAQQPDLLAWEMLANMVVATPPGLQWCIKARLYRAPSSTGDTTTLRSKVKA